MSTPGATCRTQTYFRGEIIGPRLWQVLGRRFYELGLSGLTGPVIHPYLGPYGIMRSFSPSWYELRDALDLCCFHFGAGRNSAKGY